MSRLTFEVDDLTHTKVRQYAAVLNTTRAKAAALALQEGLPAWLMAGPPSLLRECVEAGRVEDDEPDPIEELIEAISPTGGGS